MSRTRHITLVSPSRRRSIGLGSPVCYFLLKNAVILGWFRDTQIFLLSCCFFPFDLVVLLFLSSTALGTDAERNCFLVAKAGVIVLVIGFFPVVLSFGGRRPALLVPAA